MKPTITESEVKLYFTELQTKLTDSRNPKGVRHDLALVLTTMMLSILRSVGKLNVSVIHRQMKREYHEVVKILGLNSKTVVSDPQFRRILAGVDYQAYNEVNIDYFNKEIVEQSGEWQAIDGKELRVGPPMRQYRRIKW